jgi:hypothetical protein
LGFFAKELGAPLPDALMGFGPSSQSVGGLIHGARHAAHVAVYVYFKLFLFLGIEIMLC